jgi:hypothetical protein
MMISVAPRLTAVLLLVLPLIALAGDAASAAPAVSRPAASAAASSGWIVPHHTLDNLIANDRANVVPQMLDHPTTYVIVQSANDLPAGWSATPVQSFTNATDLDSAVGGKTLIPGVHTVLLDIERWQATPLDQQLQPGDAYAKAATAAHLHGVKLIATPGMDLVDGLGRQAGETAAHAYLRLKLPEQTGRDADVFEVQSQSIQDQPSTFATTLAGAQSQVSAVNAGVTFFGGLSTNPSGKQASASQMLTAVRATNGTVAGWWLNDPGQGPGCPKCRGPFPAMAVQFLLDLQQS